ncbi:MAG: hypothetical protein DWQ29_09275, partial [Planctomycetota bacterium]
MFLKRRQRRDRIDSGAYGVDTQENNKKAISENRSNPWSSAFHSNLPESPSNGDREMCVNDANGRPKATDKSSKAS